jgi:hypothetical protein
MIDDDVYILKEQIKIKSESILLLSQQLENSRREKDEYKQLIDTLYDKNLVLKKKLYNNQQYSPVDNVFFPFFFLLFINYYYFRNQENVILVLIKMMILIQK